MKPLALLVLLLASGSVGAGFTPTANYRARTVAGFTVLVHPELQKHPKEAAEALKELDTQLRNIARVLPKETLAVLQKVRFWLEWEKKKDGAAEYHGSAEWLKQHGYNPDKAKGIDLCNARNFVKWSREDQPWLVLHELAHAYHNQVLGENNTAVRAAYTQAMERKLYDSVAYVRGGKLRAYAATNAYEYFAELSEAYFGKNDFYPYTRAELEKHDPVGFQLMRKAWDARVVAKSK